MTKDAFLLDNRGIVIAIVLFKFSRTKVAILFFNQSGHQTFRNIFINKVFYFCQKSFYILHYRKCCAYIYFELFIFLFKYEKIDLKNFESDECNFQIDSVQQSTSAESTILLLSIFVDVESQSGSSKFGAKIQIGLLLQLCHDYLTRNHLQCNSRPESKPAS